MTADVLDKLGALDVHAVDGDPSGIHTREVPPATEVEETGDGTADPAVVEREHRLNRLRTYSELLQEAGRTTDRDSLARAADLAALYAEAAWVSEMPVVTRTSVRGRPMDPKSRSRFATWARERTGLAPSTVNQLLRAHDVVSTYLRTAEIIPTGEGVVRPLTRLLKEDPEAIEPVWNDAVAAVGGTVPDVGHVKAAISRWRVKKGSGQRARDSYGIPARERRQVIVAEARFLLETGHADELDAALAEVNELAAVAAAKRTPYVASYAEPSALVGASGRATS